MTAPRQILPGRTYLITRRCTQRQFLLRPDRHTTSIVLYCLAEAANRFGIELIAWCFMSNHWHGVVHDPNGRLPAFLERFHKLSAKGLNARWGRWENLWASEPTSAVHLVQPEDVFDKVVYVLANPVADQIVDRAFDWPGATSLRCMSHSVTIARPKFFFRKQGRMPERVTLVARSGFEQSGNERQWRARVLEAVRAKETAARRERLAHGTRIVGRRHVLAASAFDRPRTREIRRTLNPRIACRDKVRRIHELAALREFRLGYARARHQFGAGERHVVFPAGTYLLRITMGVCCARSDHGLTPRSREGSF